MMLVLHIDVLLLADEVILWSEISIACAEASIDMNAKLIKITTKLKLL